MILSIFVPPLGIAAAAVNMAVLPHTADSHSDVVSARSRELAAAQTHLSAQRDALALV